MEYLTSLIYGGIIFFLFLIYLNGRTIIKQNNILIKFKLVELDEK
jgi:hypothetical protein